MLNLTSKLTYSFSKTSFNSLCSMAGVSLEHVVDKLNEFASESFAEKWDNVGLLIEPHTKRPIRRILLTNDLTEKVMDEALSKSSDMIISYHPPIFAPLKRIAQKSWKERIVSICLENKIALYSPHTSWDCVRNGVNDWLAKSLPTKSSKIILQNETNPDFGAGRLCETDGSIKLKDAIQMIKDHTNIQIFKLAVGVDSSLETEIKSFAVCAGSGTSVLKGVQADLWITGEMFHHDILDANHQNINVILLNHSNSERGYLKEFHKILDDLLEKKVVIKVSEKDEDPLKSIVEYQI